jgi:hypothetical protein
MSYSKLQANKVRQQVRNDEMQVTGTLDGTTTSQILTLSLVAQKISLQASGSLAGTFEVSLDGSQWANSTAIGAVGAIVTYSTSLVKHIRVTRSGGSGTLTVAAL